MYKIGDYVRFLNEKQEGVVTRIIDHQLVGVTIDGDFEITVLANEIVLVQTGESQLREDFEEISGAVSKIAKGAEDKLYLAVHKDDKIGHLYHLHLINSSPYDLLTAVTIQKKDVFEGIFGDVVKANTATRISTHTVSEFDQGWIFHLQIIYHQQGVYTPTQPKVFRKNIKAKNILTTEKEIPFINKKGYITELESDHTIQFDKEELIEQMLTKSYAEPKLDTPNREVDLHIEELTDQFPSMSAEEMLRFQLAAFHKNLEGAIVHHFQNIIFIHGVGNGTLRNEIHKQLGKHPHVKTFKDARKEKFGYGATEVILK